MEILDKRQETLVTRERALIESLTEFLTGFGAPSGDIDLLRQTLSDMGDPFLLVIVGEFNAGKSAFVNALIGDEVAKEGSLPTTAQVTVLKYSHDYYEMETSPGVVERGVSSGLLRAVSVVDTPGTNAVIREHEQISREFVPRSDLVLFVTSADRPFSESEREYMSMIRDWGKKIVLIVNKVDVLPANEVEAMRAFVEEQAKHLLGLVPPVFMVSARGGRKAKASEASEHYRLMRKSGFGELENYIANLMGEKDLMNLKLQSPLGVAEELVRRYRNAAEERGTLLEEDVKMVESLDEALESYRDETRRDFEVRLGQITLAVSEINDRGDTWFEENSGLKSSFGGLFGRGESLQDRFQKEVVAGTGELVDRKVRELINWLVYRNVKQWRTIVDYVELHRKADLTRRLTVGIADDFEQCREGLLEGVVTAVNEQVEGYDYRQEAERLANSLRSAVSRTAATEADSLGFGGAADQFNESQSLDITGITMALMGASMELGSSGRRKVRSEFKDQTKVLRERLNAAVQRQLETELDGSVGNMRETLVPYGNFVNTELRRMKTTESVLGKLGNSTKSLANSINSQANASELGI
ncbi:MAG: dynamin family protein [Actinomycetota bacterium]|nr:dynamin family protein [Actinomycetota bacterium]